MAYGVYRAKGPSLTMVDLALAEIGVDYEIATASLEAVVIAPFRREGTRSVWQEHFKGCIASEVTRSSSMAAATSHWITRAD